MCNTLTTWLVEFFVFLWMAVAPPAVLLLRAPIADGTWDFTASARVKHSACRCKPLASGKTTAMKQWRSRLAAFREFKATVTAQSAVVLVGCVTLSKRRTDCQLPPTNARRSSTCLQNWEWDLGVCGNARCVYMCVLHSSVCRMCRDAGQRTACGGGKVSTMLP